MFGLLESAKSGCADSLNQICVIAEDAARRVLVSISFGKSRSNIDDVVQETLYEVARDLGRCAASTEDEFRSWVGTVASHNMMACARAAKAVKRGSGIAHVEIADYHAQVSPCPVSEMIGKEVVASMLEIIRDIDHSETNRQVVEMFLDGESESDISSQLGISIQGVYGVVKRLRQRLREHGITENAVSN